MNLIKGETLTLSVFLIDFKGKKSQIFWVHREGETNRIRRKRDETMPETEPHQTDMSAHHLKDRSVV